MSLTNAKTYATRCRTDDPSSIGYGAYMAFQELIIEIKRLEDRVIDLERKLKRPS